LHPSATKKFHFIRGTRPARVGRRSARNPLANLLGGILNRRLCWVVDWKSILQVVH